MRAVGSDLLHEYCSIHRFMAFVHIDDAPIGAVATELRHEAQHAHHFNQYGPHFIELDRILRDLVRSNTAVAYEERRLDSDG